jgi:hypothetical protein
MPQNPIQFQKGMSLNRFIDQYGTEEKCHQEVVPIFRTTPLGVIFHDIRPILAA